jgi:hypothetical protein
MALALLPATPMRRDVVGLGVVLAVGSLAYGSSRTVTPVVPLTARVASLVVASDPTPPAPAAIEASRPRPRRIARREGAGSIAAQVQAAAARYGVPESLVAAVISVESDFNPRAVSSRGALGLMQLMPSTAALLGVRNAFDPGENVDAGARHLRDLLDRFANDVSLALAAYNAGAQAVVRHGGVPPYPETRAFVARVLGRVGQVAMPTVAVAHAAPAPRIRLARHTADRPRREDEPVLIEAVLREDTPLSPAAALPPTPVAQRPVIDVSASVPAALVRAEAP